MQGDEIANDIFERAGFYICIAVASTLAAVGPSKIVIGGGVAQAGDLLLEPIRQTVRERFFIVPTKEYEIVQAALGADAGLIGAALWSSNLST